MDSYPRHASPFRKAAGLHAFFMLKGTGMKAWNSRHVWQWLPGWEDITSYHVSAVGAVNGSARSAARVATPRVKQQQPEAARPLPTAPLTAVVHDAVRRWFQEAHKEAQRGDVVSHTSSAIAFAHQITLKFRKKQHPNAARPVPIAPLTAARRCETLIPGSPQGGTWWGYGQSQPLMLHPPCEL